ncbi:MAG: PAS domain-containing sensor histidine kinase [Rhizobiaceae bacterium]|nr:PAS domain-containing sensor histidine kinase [Rhizobiaceae bacterium]
MKHKSRPLTGRCECVRVTIAVSSEQSSAGYLALGCLRLVNPSVAEAADRARQSRLFAVLLTGSLLIASAYAILLPPLLGGSGTVGAIWTALGAAWLVTLAVAATGKDRLAAPVALGLSAILLGFLVAVAGGLASPIALLLVVLPLESWWVRRSTASLWTGGAAALSAVPIALAFDGAVPAAAQPAAWHWLLPLAYSVTIAARARLVLGNTVETEQAPAGSQLEDLLEAVIFRMNSAGEVTDASAKARRLMGLAPELLLGSGLFDRIHVADRVAFLCALSDLGEGADLRTVELRVRLPRCPQGGNEGKYQALSFECYRDSDAGIVALARSNDELAALRGKLKAAVDAADSIDVAKARFLGAVSHELRTPLNAIIGFSDMLMHEMFGGFQDPRQKEYVGLILESGHHLLSVVNAILDVSKIESGTYRITPEPFAFSEAVGMCRSMLGLQAADKGICLEDQVSASVGLVHADRRAVQQMLINLVANAIKFTPAQGKVTIGANRVGSRVHFWVSDTGIGISEEDLKRIGQPFTQVDNDYTRRFEGTGLGLSLVKGLVGLHKGTMSIESAPGEGTVVSISLPADGPAERPEETMPARLPVKRPAATEKHDGALRKAG